MDKNCSNNNCKGRFLWMEDAEQQNYLCELRERIARGHFNNDSVLVKIIEELAPAFYETSETEAA